VRALLVAIVYPDGFLRALFALFIVFWPWTIILL